MKKSHVVTAEAVTFHCLYADTALEVVDELRRIVLYYTERAEFDKREAPMFSNTSLYHDDEQWTMELFVKEI